MYKYLNKGISTPIAIGIILFLVILVAGFTWWQYGEIRKDEANILEAELPDKEFCGSSLDNCDGKKMILDGEIAKYTVWQHAGMGLSLDIEDYEEYEYSEYFDLDREYMQIVLRSKERIDCENKLKVQGLLKVVEMEFDLPEVVGKRSIRDYYLFVDKWKCLDETANWETYRNYEHEFEIKYPVGWHIEKNKGKFPNRDEKFDIIKNEWIGVGILCESRPDNLNWNEWLEAKDIIEYEEFTQDSLEGIKVVEKSKVVPEDIFLSDKNKICGFVLFFQSEEPPREEFKEKEEEGKDIFNQMLSTFRFLD